MRWPGTGLVVVGDALLDRDISGTVRRLCPDAPVPVLDEGDWCDRPGGAALAAVLAAARGHRTTLVTALSDDRAGRRLRDLLAVAGVRLLELPGAGPTAEKIRLRADDRVLLRWDRGGSPASLGEPAPAVREAIGRADGVLVSDYGRGVAAVAGLRAALAGRRGGPLVWDPHPHGATPVPGSDLVTPNRAEAGRFAGRCDTDGEPFAAAAGQAQRLRRRWAATAVTVTLGDDGALVDDGAATATHWPAPPVTGGDACGAGDCFGVSATVSLAEGGCAREAVRHAVVEASRFVAAGGAGAVRLGEPDAGPEAVLALHSANPTGLAGRLDRHGRRAG